MILEGPLPVLAPMQNINLLEPPSLFPFPSGISEEGLVCFRDSHSLESMNLSILAYPLHLVKGVGMDKATAKHGVACLR